MVDFGSDDRIGAKWNAATATIAYGRMAKEGHYHAFIADGDGSRERRVAFAAWRDDCHQFPAAWHPAGEYLVLLVEQNEHERSSVDAIPGYGAYTDYWVATRDGARAWKLYGLPDGYDHAITHAAFSPDGSDMRRLTFMNLRGHAESVGRFRLAGSLSFVSDTAFFGDVLTQSLGLVGKIVRVDCD